MQSYYRRKQSLWRVEECATAEQWVEAMARELIIAVVWSRGDEPGSRDFPQSIPHKHTVDLFLPELEAALKREFGLIPKTRLRQKNGVVGWMQEVTKDYAEVVRECWEKRRKEHLPVPELDQKLLRELCEKGAKALRRETTTMSYHMGENFLDENTDYIRSYVARVLKAKSPSHCR